MTTAHRPTFDPARGKDAQRGVAYHQRLLPAHTQLKTRQPGQGGDADPQVRDLRAQLLEAEAAHFSKTNPVAAKSTESTISSKRQIEDGPGQNGEEDLEAKRRRILEETRDVDADSDGSKGDDSSEEDSDDEEDETAELLRELEKIKRERAEQKEKEEREKAAVEQEKRENDIALGNPLLMPMKDAETNRRWDDDVVFRNQARGTENKGKKEFVNDLLRASMFDNLAHQNYFGKRITLLVVEETSKTSTQSTLTGITRPPTACSA
ncbi:MAG: complexed with cef1p [Alectoria sarmentosa]|nr:MAG: complexed with cef1p [Alectoria sarmentosa]